MDPYAITLSDVLRLIEALDQAGGQRLIQALIERVPPSTFSYGRVTLGMIMPLLEQTDGRTYLPPVVAALLRQWQQEGTVPPAAAGGAVPTINHHQASCTWDEARYLINIAIPLEAVENHLQVSFLPKQRAALQAIPFRSSTLKKCQKTHILFPGYPLTLAGLAHAVPPALLDNILREQMLRGTRPAVGLRWYLLRRSLMPKSVSNIYAWQQTHLPRQEEMPQLGELIYGMLIMALYTGQHLFSRYYVRSATVDGPSVPAVGCFTRTGGRIKQFTTEAWRGSNIIGAASMRQLHT